MIQCSIPDSIDRTKLFDFLNERNLLLVERKYYSSPYDYLYLNHIHKINAGQDPENLKKYKQVTFNELMNKALNHNLTDNTFSGLELMTINDCGVCTKDKICVKVTPELSQLLQTIAFKFGYKWHMGEGKLQYLDASYLFFYKHDKSITYESTGSFDSANIEECLRFITDIKPKIMIDGHEVEIKPGESIKVGCTVIPKEDVEAIIKTWRTNENCR